MSASNWAVCPRCVKRAEAARAKQVAAVGASYGKVPEQEYAESVKSIHDVKPDDYQTFREDYEIYGAEDGIVKVSYGGGCGVCGLGLSFNDEHPIEGIDQ